MVSRLVIACEGGLVGAAVVATVEGSPGALLADFGVLVPLALGVSVVVAAAHLYFDPLARTPAEIAAEIRAEPVLARSRTAALAPLVVVASFAVLLVLSVVARALLSRGAPAEVGLELAAVGCAVLGAGTAAVLALVSPLRRVLARGAERLPRLIDPLSTGAVAFLVTLGLFLFGLFTGDAGGNGRGPIAVFGVLGRAELDLRPLLDALAIATCAVVFPVVLARGRRAYRAALLALLVCATSLAWTVREARALNAEPATVRRLERLPLGHLALAGLRRATDRDKDGSSPLFGGGDCDDHDPRRNPLAFDVPGNGVDEDCSGSDAVLPPAPPRPTRHEDPPPSLPPDLNVLLITIDTLRLEAGFTGYAKATTPNLDALAAKSVVFDRTYALASYTGKSIGPLLIGKYPSETDRDGGHFNKYSSKNVFVTARLHEAGVRTFGAASHWYFDPWSGLSQGMDEWDMSAKPSEGQGENDTSVTGDRVSDAALRLLARPENTARRFFAWLHYFDPHAQYVPHDGSPDFLGEGRGGVAATRALYDGEVWFTDHHVGRVLSYVASQPWGAHTAIVVTSDHGEAFGEHNMSWHGGELWECLVRVPLLVYVPGATPHHVGAKRSHIDLVPTLLDLFGVHTEETWSGQSLLPDMLSPGPYAERDVYFDMPIGPYTGMRKGLLHDEMKLHYAGGQTYQLFDLATDPDESKDLSGDPALLTPMVERFQSERARRVEIDVKPDAP